MSNLVIGKTKTNAPKTTGRFSFNLFEFGDWRQITVDGMVPVLGSAARVPAFLSAEDKELWMPLLEKALAKLMGTARISSPCKPHD